MKRYEITREFTGRAKLQIRMFCAIGSSSSVYLHLVVFRTAVTSLQRATMRESTRRNPSPPSPSLRMVGVELTEERSYWEEI